MWGKDKVKNRGRTVLCKGDWRIRGCSSLGRILEQFRLKSRDMPKLGFFFPFQSWNNNSKKGTEHKPHLNTGMDNALHQKRGTNKSEIFPALVPISLLLVHILLFRLPLKGAAAKLPSLNARILGVLRFSYNPNLVSQYKTPSHSTGKESIPWTGSSAQFLSTFQTLRARDICMCVSISSQLSFLCCTESLSPLTKPYLFVGFFILGAQSKPAQHCAQHLLPNLPWGRWPLPLALFLSAVWQTEFPLWYSSSSTLEPCWGSTEQGQWHWSAWREQFRDIILHQCRPLMPT